MNLYRDKYTNADVKLINKFYYYLYQYKIKQYLIFNYIIFFKDFIVLNYELIKYFYYVL